MKTERLIVLLASLALFASPAIAGAPDNPGAGGQAVKAAVEATKAGGATWGSVVSEFVHTTDGNLGGAIQDAKDALGGSPNPANDNGGGNDP